MRTIELELLLELPDHLEDGTPAYWAGLMQDLIDNRWQHLQSTFTKITVASPIVIVTERKLWESLPSKTRETLIQLQADDMRDSVREYAIGYLEGLDDEVIQELVDDAKEVLEQEESKKSG